MIKNKNILITGGNSGIGFFAIINLLKTKNILYVVIKNEFRKNEFLRKIEKHFDKNYLSKFLNIIENCDLSDLENINKIKDYFISKKIFLMNISNNAGIDSNDLAKRGESLIRKSTNRYLTTVKIAFRAKQRRFDDFDGLLEESTIKPVQRSIIELSDEQDQPDLLPG